MAHYRQVGPVPGKRHTLFNDDDGRILSEELMGEEGFSSDSSLLYHRHIPSSIVGARPWELPDQTLTPNEPLLPRHLRLHDLFTDEQAAGTDAVTGRRLILGNGDVRISYARVGLTSPLYKNAIGDECVYVERGSALLETQFGALEVAEGDYAIIPRATIHRWVLREGETARLYGVLDKRLAGRDFIAGDYSIADMAIWPWILPEGQGQDLNDFPKLKAWVDRVWERPAVQRGRKLGKDLRSNLGADGKEAEAARKVLFGQKAS